MPFDFTYRDYVIESLDMRVGNLPVSLDTYFGDGKSYSDSIFFQSPEGNYYGQTTIVRDFPVGYFWDGEDYVEVRPTINASNINDLPTVNRLNYSQASVNKLTITQADIANKTTTDVVIWDVDSDEWVRLEWFAQIEGYNNLPRPGLKRFAAHVVIYKHIQLMWDGFRWIIWPPHSNIPDDEPDRHISRGFLTGYQNYQTNTNGAIQFLQSQQAEARLEFFSKTTLGLVSSVTGKTGAVWVSGELLLTDSVADVENTDSVVVYSEGAVTTEPVSPETEYFVYCGNSQFSPVQGRLFLCLTPDVNGRLGDELPGTNARVVGKVETDSEGYFVREIDMSFIGKRVEFSQTYWEYSDYQLVFVDQDTLEFQRIDGTHGLCYINGQLLSLGTGKELLRDAYRIEWDDAGLILDINDIASSLTYQIYIANDSYEYNFNVEGDDGFPLDEGDGGYIWQLDFRRRLFLSTKAHDHRKLDEQYPGYYARHIGQVQTDENGRFRYAADISLIRQPTLNPTHLDGLAECVIQNVSTTQFKVTRKKGTTGIVYVGGRPVQTYDADNPLVHIVTTSDALYEYDETEIDGPLTDSGLTVAEKPGVSIYLYMANEIDCWQGISTFCSLESPHAGYLSTNWPGNQARWLATLQLSPSAVGSELITNGSFTTDTSWTKGTGWSWVSENQNMTHAPGNSGVLSQTVSLIEGDLYTCSFYISGRTVGGVAPVVAGTLGSSLNANSSSLQYLLAGSDGSIKLRPDSLFDGEVDTVSLKKVISGDFTGTYVKDSVAGTSAQIDDSVVSSVTTYSSNKIEQIKTLLLGKIDLSLGFSSTQTSGYNFILEYIDSTTIRVRALDEDQEIIFPNLDTLTLTTTGINKTVVGSISTFYYVYLTTAGELDILTSSPDSVYSAVQFYGVSNLLVGYMGFSAVNTISGDHNVYSFVNQSTKQWTNSLNRPGSIWDSSHDGPTTTTGTTVLTSLNGLVIPPGKVATYSTSGGFACVSSLYVYRYNRYFPHPVHSGQTQYCRSGLGENFESESGYDCIAMVSPPTTGLGNFPIWWCGFFTSDYWNLQYSSDKKFDLTTSVPTLSQGVYHNITISASATVQCPYLNAANPASFSLVPEGSTSLIVTRPGS